MLVFGGIIVYFAGAGSWWEVMIGILIAVVSAAGLAAQEDDESETSEWEAPARDAGRALVPEEKSVARKFAADIYEQMAYWMRQIAYAEMSDIELTHGRTGDFIQQGWEYRDLLRSIDTGGGEWRRACANAKHWLKFSRKLKRDNEEPLGILEFDQLSPPMVDEVDAWVRNGDIPHRWFGELGTKSKV